MFQADHCSPIAAAGSVGNVHVAVYRGALTTDELWAVHHAHLALLERHPTSAVLSVAEQGTPLPGAEVRELAGRFGDEVADRVRCSCQVILGDGFWASAARSLITAMLFIRTGKYPVRICSDVVEAVEFVAATNRGGPTPMELSRAIAALRESR